MVNLYKLLSSKGTLFAFVVGLLAILIFLFPVISGLNSFNALPEPERKASNIFNIGITMMLFLLVIAVVVTIAGALYQMIMNPKGAKMGFLWIGILIVLFVIGFYVLNQPDNANILADLKANNVSAGTSKLVGGGLWVMLIMIFASVGIFVFSEVRNLFK